MSLVVAFFVLPQTSVASQIWIPKASQAYPQPSLHSDVSQHHLYWKGESGTWSQEDGVFYIMYTIYYWKRNFEYVTPWDELHQKTFLSFGYFGLFVVVTSLLVWASVPNLAEFCDVELAPFSMLFINKTLMLLLIPFQEGKGGCQMWRRDRWKTSAYLLMYLNNKPSNKGWGGSVLLKRERGALPLDKCFCSSLWEFLFAFLWRRELWEKRYISYYSDSEKAFNVIPIGRTFRQKKLLANSLLLPATLIWDSRRFYYLLSIYFLWVS